MSTRNTLDAKARRRAQRAARKLPSRGPGRVAAMPNTHGRPADKGDDWFYPASRVERRADRGLLGALVSPAGLVRKYRREP